VVQADAQGPVVADAGDGRGEAVGRVPAGAAFDPPVVAAHLDDVAAPGLGLDSVHRPGTQRDALFLNLAGTDKVGTGAGREHGGGLVVGGDQQRVAVGELIGDPRLVGA